MPNKSKEEINRDRQDEQDKYRRRSNRRSFIDF
jgi:hypothetical protein